MLSVAVVCCLLVSVFGLQGQEQSNEFLFLLEKIDKLQEKLTALENSNSQKDINVNLDLAESHCEAGEVIYNRSFGTRYVTFSKPFTKVPAVTIGFMNLDSFHDKNLRVDCTKTSITTTGFKLQCKPWGDSVLYQVNISWMAC